jgi:hypothetical protein
MRDAGWRSTYLEVFFVIDYGDEVEEEEGGEDEDEYEDEEET